MDVSAGAHAENICSIHIESDNIERSFADTYLPNECLAKDTRRRRSFRRSSIVMKKENGKISNYMCLFVYVLYATVTNTGYSCYFTRQTE